MKRSLFIVAFGIQLSAISMLTAQAADYPYLVFTNTSGTSTVLSVSNLTMSVSGSELQVTNAEGNTSFVLTDLANMQFSVDGSAVSAIGHVLDGGQPVRVYSMTGVALGTFGSLAEGVEMLSAGAYVVKQGKNTQTIVVK